MIVLRGSRRDGRGLSGLAALLFASQLVPTVKTATAAERRGGIEIGSKGVKMTVVELAEKPGGRARILQSAILNTTISAGAVKTLVFDRNSATAWLQALLDPSRTPPATPDVEATEVSRPATVTRVAERTPAAESAKAADPPQAARATAPAPAPAREEPGRLYPSPQSPLAPR